ncbi:class I SAM-dependent DNA methyltransferase [Thiocapsa bogorovii]|uniref:class I SAM-dependent DNA methyltransferase n=1 Tax=Thiocapsa bogorovii TaxID=521689 RepID=UPI001E3B369B|nr:class I SAM-dependent methyltransferase [Thiocapsa bogorovii]UHD15641.1 class I SAM-dependent methyltransferase [Thiocapsa bogorovii]
MIRDLDAPRGPKARAIAHHRIPPYAGLAADYDALVGDALFPIIRRSFEACVRRRGLRFRSIADIGCGTGRFLGDLLRRYDVPMIGVDRSPHMLEVAARRLRGLGVVLLRQDMRRLRLPYPVDLMTCNGDTLNYLVTMDDLVAALRGCRENLTPGGYLLGDLLSGRPAAEAHGSEDVLLAPSGRTSRWRATCGGPPGTTRVEIRFGRHGEAREFHLQRWHSLADIEAAAHRAGLRLVSAAPLLMETGHRERAAWLKIMIRRVVAPRGLDRGASTAPTRHYGERL